MVRFDHKSVISLLTSHRPKKYLTRVSIIRNVLLQAGRDLGGKSAIDDDRPSKVVT